MSTSKMWGECWMAKQDNNNKEGKTKTKDNFVLNKNC